MIAIIRVNSVEHMEMVRAIRRKVFVVEQQCPEELEWEFEDESHHFLAFKNGVAAGTARWRETEKGIKLERFAVLNEFRKEGVGKILLSSILEDIPQKRKEVYLHAQIHAAPFYEKNNFIRDGQHFWEAGIEHVKMKRRD